MQLLKNCLIVFFLLPLIKNASAQEVHLLGDYSVYFPDSIVRKRKVKCIRVESSIKSENSRIEHKLDVNTFYFDSLGRISKQVSRTELDFINHDSTVYAYYYNKTGKLSIIRKYASLKYYALYYEYDSLGNCLKQVECSETNDSHGGPFFKIGRQKTNWFESFSYEKLGPNQTKKKFFNDEGIIYKEGILYTDSKGRIVEENYRYSATSIIVNNKITYNEKDEVVEKINFSNASGEITEKSDFVRDKVSATTRENKYYNGVFTNEIYYFYDKQYELLDAIIDKNPSSGRLYMKKFIVEL